MFRRDLGPINLRKALRLVFVFISGGNSNYRIRPQVRKDLVHNQGMMPKEENNTMKIKMIFKMPIAIS